MDLVAVAGFPRLRDCPLPPPGLHLGREESQTSLALPPLAISSFSFPSGEPDRLGAVATSRNGSPTDWARAEPFHRKLLSAGAPSA